MRPGHWPPTLLHLPSTAISTGPYIQSYPVRVGRGLCYVRSILPYHMEEDERSSLTRTDWLIYISFI